MSIVLKTPSNGSVTLAEQDTASDVVVTIPAGTSTLVTNDTLPAQLNASGSAPIYACRAWVNFNGTGTVAIRASGNVTSITDNGTGNYTVNFTTAMQDANYSINTTSASAGSSVRLSSPGTLATGSSQVLTVNSNNSALEDQTFVFVSIFR